MFIVVPTELTGVVVNLYADTFHSASLTRPEHEPWSYTPENSALGSNYITKTKAKSSMNFFELTLLHKRRNPLNPGRWGRMRYLKKRSHPTPAAPPTRSHVTRDSRPPKVVSLSLLWHPESTLDLVSISQPPCWLAPQQPQRWDTFCPRPQGKHCRRHVCFAFASGLGNLLPLPETLLPDPACNSKSGGSSSRWAPFSWVLWPAPLGASTMDCWPQRRGPCQERTFVPLRESPEA